MSQTALTPALLELARRQFVVLRLRALFLHALPRAFAPLLQPRVSIAPAPRGGVLPQPDGVRLLLRQAFALPPLDALPLRRVRVPLPRGALPPVQPPVHARLLQHVCVLLPRLVPAPLPVV